MSDAELENVQSIWVLMGEASEITGYSQQYLGRLAHKMSRMSEAERPIRVRSRAKRYELWLPDLIRYMEDHLHGPRNSSESNQ
jgi:hypothetical protein